jgi:hypothetical protein
MSPAWQGEEKEHVKSWFQPGCQVLTEMKDRIKVPFSSDGMLSSCGKLQWHETSSSVLTPAITPELWVQLKSTPCVGRSGRQ